MVPIDAELEVLRRWASGSEGRTLTADTDLRLWRLFGLSDGWWLRLQAGYHTEAEKASLAKTLAMIRL